MRNVTSAAILAAFLFLAGGCVRSIQPILQDNQLISGETWLGYWMTDEKELIAIGHMQQGQGAPATQPTQDKMYPAFYLDKEGKVGTFTVRFGKVGDLTIAESRATDPRPEASDMYKMHVLPLFSFAIVGQGPNDDMTMRLMDPKWLKTYLADHPTELSYAMPDGDDPIITASTTDLQAFLLKHWQDKGAFGDAVPLHRIPAPPGGMK